MRAIITVPLALLATALLITAPTAGRDVPNGVDCRPDRLFATRRLRLPRHFGRSATRSPHRKQERPRNALRNSQGGDRG